MWTLNVDWRNLTKWKDNLKVKGKKLPSKGTTTSPWWDGRAGRGPLTGARTHRGERLADQSQTSRGTRAEEGEDNWEGSAPLNDPSTPRAKAPVRARKNKSKGPSVILRAWGIRCLATTSPWELQTTRTQTATTGTPQRTYRLSPARRHLLGNQPTQTKSNISFIVSA
jgi:hypothetical protein